MSTLCVGPASGRGPNANQVGYGAALCRRVPTTSRNALRVPHSDDAHKSSTTNMRAESVSVRCDDPGSSAMSHRNRHSAGRWIAIIALVSIATAGCDVSTMYQRLSEASRLSADLLVHFTEAADAANRAVMADTDEASIAFAGEAEQAKQAIHRDTDALRPILQGLGYEEETRLLDEFSSRFADYSALDQSILELAVENTNLKAQRLSFGPAQENADSFQNSIETVAPLDASKDAWRVKALVATAVAAVREIQALQAPHIAEADDAAMSRIEKRMATSERAARSALEMLAPLIQPASRSRLAAAIADLDSFMRVNTQLTALSRRNSNVRSLALTLTKKGKLTVACEESLSALRGALAKRGATGTR